MHCVDVLYIPVSFKVTSFSRILSTQLIFVGDLSISQIFVVYKQQKSAEAGCIDFFKFSLFFLQCIYSIDISI